MVQNLYFRGCTNYIYSFWECKYTISPMIKIPKNPTLFGIHTCIPYVCVQSYTALLCLHSSSWFKLWRIRNSSEIKSCHTMFRSQEILTGSIIPDNKMSLKDGLQRIFKILARNSVLFLWFKVTIQITFSWLFFFNMRTITERPLALKCSERQLCNQVVIRFWN